MAEKDTISSQEEAKNLVEEAKEAERAGDKDEARFLREAAKELDPSADKPAGHGHK